MLSGKEPFISLSVPQQIGDSKTSLLQPLQPQLQPQLQPLQPLQPQPDIKSEGDNKKGIIQLLRESRRKTIESTLNAISAKLITYSNDQGVKLSESERNSLRLLPKIEHIDPRIMALNIIFIRECIAEYDRMNPESRGELNDFVFHKLKSLDIISRYPSLFSVGKKLEDSNKLQEAIRAAMYKYITYLDQPTPGDNNSNFFGRKIG
jgi:hypothetical protein